jgi:hypothetical protein
MYLNLFLRDSLEVTFNDYCHFDSELARRSPPIQSGKPA